MSNKNQMIMFDQSYINFVIMFFLFNEHTFLNLKKKCFFFHEPCLIWGSSHIMIQIAKERKLCKALY